MAARAAIRQQAADTTDATSSDDTDTEPATGDSDEDGDNPFPLLRQIGGRLAADPDSRAARRANKLVQSGLTRKAAQVLHSTTQMADMRRIKVQKAMARLHLLPSSGNALPTLPQMAPASLDADLRQLISQSDNGTAAGPSGWGGLYLTGM